MQLLLITLGGLATLVAVFSVYFLLGWLLNPDGILNRYVFHTKEDRKLLRLLIDSVYDADANAFFNSVRLDIKIFKNADSIVIREPTDDINCDPLLVLTDNNWKCYGIADEILSDKIDAVLYTRRMAKLKSQREEARVSIAKVI